MRRHDWLKTGVGLLLLSWTGLALEAKAQGEEVAEVAVTDPPPSYPTQGIRLHGTGIFENTNIRLDSATNKYGCSFSFKKDKGVLIAKKADGSDCSDEQVVGTVFSAPWAGRTASFKIEKVRSHYVPYLIQNQAPTSTRLSSGGLMPTVPVVRSLSYPQEYRISYSVNWDAQQTLTGYLCDNKEENEERFVLAVPHAWTKSGELLANPDYFTFACASRRIKDSSSGKEFYVGGSVITKCIDWGYPPWLSQWKTRGGKVLDGSTKGGNTLTKGVELALKFHQVCVRMASADYCDEGTANTLEGTPFDFRDVFTVDVLSRHKGDKSYKKIASTLPNGASGRFKWVTESNKYTLEAVWGIDSCGRVKAMCLSKKRWASLPSTGACSAFSRRPLLPPGVFLPPYSGMTIKPISPDFLEKAGPPKPMLSVRSLQSGPNGSSNSCGPSSAQSDQVLCSELNAAELEARGALLYSYSAFFDRGLYRFESTKNEKRFLTTTDVDIDGATITQSGFVYGLSSAWKDVANDYGKSVAYEGPILSTQLPANWNKSGLKPLYQCVKGGKDFLLTDNANCTVGNETPQGYKDAKLEGHIYSGKQPEAIALNLYSFKSPEGEIRYVTSTVPPSGVKLEGSEQLLGYLPSLNQLAEEFTALAPEVTE